MSRPSRPARTPLLPLVALAGLALVGCAGGASAPGIPPRAPGVVDIVGSAYLVNTQAAAPSPLPSFVELWIEAAGLDAQDRRLLYTYTGDAGGIALFCRLRQPPTSEEFRTKLASLPPGDPERATVQYALANLPYLYDATIALLSRAPTREEAAQCREAGVAFAELLLAEGSCDGRACPALALVKADRLDDPLVRRLLDAVATEPGLLDDLTGLAVAGLRPLSEEEAFRSRAAAQRLLGQRRPQA